MTVTRKQGMTPHRFRTLARLRVSAWRWRAELRAVHAQGYAAASKTISPREQLVHGRELLAEAVEALRAERASSGANVPQREDPVVVFAYGLGAWPSGADLTSLKQLLERLGVSQGSLRNRFEGLSRSGMTASQSSHFRELAGASFVLGASSRIVEAAMPAAKNVPPPPWLAAIKARLR